MGRIIVVEVSKLEIRTGCWSMACLNVALFASTARRGLFVMFEAD